MTEEVSPWVGLGTWVGLAAFVVLSIVKGWLLPKSSVDSLVSQMEKRLNDRDELIRELRAANAALDARNDLLSDQIRELVGVGHSTAEVVTATVVGALPSGGGGYGPGDSGSPDPTANGGAKARLNKIPSRRGRRR